VSSSEQDAIYITVGRAGEAVRGFTWRIWARSTSFYLKSRAPGMNHLKLSLHGIDPRHEGKEGFKIGMDPEPAFQQAVDEGRVAALRTGSWPIWFPGQRLNNDSTLVGRLRWTWDACTRLGPAPHPGELKKGAAGLVAPLPPEPGDAVDVDLILSQGKPYWPSEKKARQDNACLGPLRNTAGDWLTGVVVKRLAYQYAPPETAIGPRPKNSSDEIRAVSAAIDETGFLWLIEQRMSRQELTALSADRQGSHRP
jgi:hypothetical protein